MPAIEQNDRKQKAVLWPATGVDRNGQPTRGEPVEVNVRWQFKRRQITDDKGNPVAVDATVVVDRVIADGSAMWLGELADWYGTGSGGDDSRVMEVVQYSESPDIKGRKVMRTVALAFYKDTLPDPT